ncbi:phosphotransferase 1, variant 2 [Perkinsus olseni]|uniref:Phosphotransferase 1, variant 2 n=1 Tax=Perkinsus olseni TaxID=32597 RepID=A0A7J6TL12_PEROL|nr:phosphotransferase 1, variant 2 [Perkinsus olseni]
MGDYTSFWHVKETLPFVGGSFQRCDIALVLMLSSAILITLNHVYGVYSHLTKFGFGSQQKRMNTRTRDLHHAFSTAAPYCVGVILACLWVTFSPEGVAAQHPRLTIWFIGILFSYTVAMIQVIQPRRVVAARTSMMRLGLRLTAQWRGLGTLAQGCQTCGIV